MTERDAYARRHTAIERAVWVLIMGAPLLVLAFMAVSALTRHAPPVRTGDALLDAFLQELVDRDELASPVLRGAGSYFGTDTRVSDAVFASLEEQYGKDPRFWMLCYRLRDPRSDPRWSDVNPDTDNDYVKYLEEAESRGIADGPSLFKLLQTRQDDWGGAAATQLGIAHPGRKATPGELYAYHHAIRNEIDRHHFQEEQQLLEDLFAAAPDQALPHYYAAKYACERGDYGEAIAELRNGNAAARCDPMLGFPQDDAQEALHRRQLLGDKLISGWLAANANLTPYFIRYKDFVKDMAYLAVQRKDARALDELHKFTCRFCGQDPVDLLTASVGAALIRVAYDEVQRDWPGGLSTAQQTKLKSLDARYSRLRAAEKAVWQSSNQANAMLMGPGPVTMQGMAGFLWTQLTDRLTGRRSETLRYLKAWYSDKLAKRQGMEQQVRPLFDDIAKFSYSEALKQ